MQAIDDLPNGATTMTKKVQGNDKDRAKAIREIFLLMLTIVVLLAGLLVSASQVRRTRAQRDDLQAKVTVLQARLDGWERFDDLPKGETK